MTVKHIIISLIVLSIAWMACGQKKDTKTASPPGYDLDVFEKILLSDGLLEVSGITFAPAEPDSLYAHQDEEGALFKVGLPSGKYRRVDFGITGDYEDIAIMADTLLLLRSDGSFYGFITDSLLTERVKPQAFWEQVLPKGEYEGLFADALTNSYFVLCKSCKTDKKKPQTTVYQLRIYDNSLQVVNQYTIDTEKINVQSGKKKDVFQPAAIARHPVSKDFYIVSSANKALVIMNEQWGVKNIYPLGRKHLMQPEGLAFDREGNMYISSEGDELQAGRILKFAYKK